jgi:regulator of replication initiation timing
LKNESEKVHSPVEGVVSTLTGGSFTADNLQKASCERIAPSTLDAIPDKVLDAMVEKENTEPKTKDYEQIINNIDEKLTDIENLSSIQQSNLIQDVLKQIPKLTRADQDRYIKLLSEKFNITQRALKEDMQASIPKEKVSIEGRNFGNVYEIDGYGINGNRQLGYMKVEFPFGKQFVSTFIIKPKSKLWIDGFEAINATFQSLQETIEDVVIERKYWNTPERFMDIIPSAKMNWTGDRKDVQSVMMIVSSYDTPTQIATQQIGWHKDKIWVAPNINLISNGIIEPQKVFYYPMGGANILDSIVTYSECNDSQFAELQTQAKKLLELNETDVTIPIIGWFHAACAKKWWLNFPTLRHFPHLNVAGSRGSGKTTLIEIFWQVFGWTGDALINCSMSRFALLRTFASTHSFPVVLDEFKPSNMPDDRVANIREFMRHSYGGAIDQRGRPDQSLVAYYLTAPICLVGETPYYPLEAAAIERVIPVHTNFNAINPDTEQGKQRIELCWQLQQFDFRGYLSRYIRYLTTIDFDQQVEYAREDAARYLGERNVPRRIWDNLAAMVFGIRQYENFVKVVIGDSQIEHAVQTIITYLCGEAGTRGKLAFELALEQMAVMAELGRLKKEIHYLIDENKRVCLRLSACLSEFRKFARETNWMGEVLDDSAYRRQIVEIQQEGRLVVEASYPTRGWQGDWSKMARAVIIADNEPNVDLSGFFIAKDWSENNDSLHA